jgi:outer membrane protein assembly factor BamB
MRRFAPVLALAAAIALAGCDMFDRWFGSPPKVPLPGERQAVLTEETRLAPDPRLAQVPVRLPAAIANDSWPQPGGEPSHAMPPLAADGIAVAWRTSVGSGSGRNGRVSGAPVIAEGRAYAMDAGTQVTAVDAQSGARIWTFDVEPKEDSGGAGGGVAVAGDRLFVATGFAQLIALEAATGKEIWRSALTAPLRAGPTVAAGKVFAVTIDNQVHALDAATGRKLWAHAGITENAGLYGSASPAFEGNIVIATFSSGEIFALRADNGRVLWSDSLAGLLRSDAVSALADVRGLPVVDRGQVLAVSHAGRMAAIDLRSGGRVWEQNVGSLYTPLVAGDFLFVTTPDAEVVCLSRREGRVRWVRQLDRWTDPQRKRGLIVWTNPVAAGDQLFLTSSRGDGVALSPADGTTVATVRLPGPAILAPVVANRTIYVLTDNADLVALR